MLNPKLKNLLVTGGSGTLGSNYVEQLSDVYNVYYNYFKNKINIKNTKGVKLDFLKIKNLKKFITEIRPEIIIHTIAESNVENCEKNKKNAYQKNILIVKNLIKLCKDFNIKLVYISTDHLNSNLETSKPIIYNYYAKTKYEAENIILKNLKDSVIIRTNFFGDTKAKKKSFSEKIIQKLSKKENVFLFTDVFFSPILMDELIDKTKIVINDNLKGIYNICSNENISKYNFGTKIAKIYGFNKKYLKKIQLKDRKELVPRPKNMILNNKKFTKKTKLFFNSIEKNIKFMKTKELFNNNHTVKKIIPYGTHYIDKNDIDNVSKVLLNGPITQGPEIEKFEKNFAKSVGSNYAIAVSSCTAGLHLSTLALELSRNDEMITSAISFVSSANAGRYNSLKVFFSDIEKNTLNISSKTIKNTIINYKLNKLKLVIPVHFAGLPCDMLSISNLAQKYKFNIIEDAAHGLGAKYKCGSKVGSCKYSLATVFSLHPVKSIAAGEGGVITTNNTELYKKILRLRSHGINKGDDKFENYDLSNTNGSSNPWYYEMQELGYHYRITDIQCALANSQLKKLNDFINKRRKIFRLYKEEFKKFKNIRPIQDNYQFSSHHLFVVKINYNKLPLSRNEIMRFLRKKNIITQVHYLPIFFHPYYREKKYDLSLFNNSIDYYNSALSLPIYYNLSYQDQKYVIKQLKIIDSIE